MDQGAGDGDPLLLTSGKLVRESGGTRIESDPLQPFLRRLRDIAGAGEKEGKLTFSRIVRVGSSWKNWKTKPMWVRRRAVSAASFRELVARPSTRTSPEVGKSMAPARLRSVVLPQPLRPNSAVTVPGGKTKLTS